MPKNKKKIMAVVLLIVFCIVAVVGSLPFRGAKIAGGAVGSVLFENYDAVEVGGYLKGGGNVTVTQEDSALFFDGAGTESALIFYPGANVEYTAYAPLMYKLAQRGMDCFLVKMPLNYAFLGVNKADDIIKNYSYSSWNLAGHSLGGSMAASYAAKTSYQIDGLYLLAAYPTANVKNVGDVLYIYGENDKVLSADKVESSFKYAPDNYRIYVIPGGNHAQFGSYGAQSGDGIATVSAEAQLNQTVEQIMLLK